MKFVTFATLLSTLLVDRLRINLRHLVSAQDGNYIIRALQVARAVMGFAQAGMAAAGKCATHPRTSGNSGGKSSAGTACSDHQ